MRILISLFSGLIFGLGLIMSGMADPAKVQNFLDIFGTWDPSLVFVMGGAIAVALPGFWLAGKTKSPLYAPNFNLPTRTDIDRNLILGSGLFGIGWGLIGLCPGPALVGLGSGRTEFMIFACSMIGGIYLSKIRTGTSLTSQAS